MKYTISECCTFDLERENCDSGPLYSIRVTRLCRFIAFISSFGGLFVHEYSGRFLDPVPVFTSVTDTQNDPPTQTQSTQYISTFSISGQWYLLWSGTGSSYPGTNCRLLMPSQIAGQLEETAVTFASITGISSLASKKAE
jgi:hypothetical protein